MKFEDAIERLSQNIDKNGGQTEYQKEVVETIKYFKNKYSKIYIVAVVDNAILGSFKYVHTGVNYSKTLEYVNNTFGNNWYDLGVSILEKEIEE